MLDVCKRLYFLVPAVLVALLQHTIHEGTHYVAARLLGVQVLEFRFLTNGVLTSQVVYATPVAERTGAGWLVIAWALAAVGWPRWPVHVLAGLVLLFNLRLVVKLRQEGKAQPERYLPAS
jgi:hypothetical protein